MEFLNEYGLFLAKTATFLVAFLIVIAIVAALSIRAKKQQKGHLEVQPLNDNIQQMRDTLRDALVSPPVRKKLAKAKRKEEKQRHKSSRDTEENKKPRLFVLNFKGDLRAAAVTALREEITAVLGLATKTDEVLVRLESAGGMVHSYGLAASQLDRIKKQGVPLTICVDKVAASGGYMMACVADKILAAPFAILGSIGVVAQIPNFHRLLKKHHVDIELMTAGEYKRTLTLFGENTDKGRQKFKEDLEITHDLFKQYVGKHRPVVDINKIATGEIWLGTRARELNLVDDLQTSDEYITARLESDDMYEVSYVQKKTLPQKIGLAAEESADNLLSRWLQRFSERGI